MQHGSSQKPSGLAGFLECEKNALKRLVFYGLKFNLKVLYGLLWQQRGVGAPQRLQISLTSFESVNFC